MFRGKRPWTIQKTKRAASPALFRSSPGLYKRLETRNALGVSDLPRGTVTFLFTDIEGSTRLLAELGSEYAIALAEHRRLLREAFRARGGVEVDTQGDAFFYAFEEAADAVLAAADAQELLTSGPIRVRMGVHTGEPQLTDEGYVGLDVHAGARVAACAHGRQVVLTKRTRDLVDATFRFRDLGEHRLKDLDEAVWLYQLGDELFPPLKSLSNTNLPIPASSFLGRERELAEAQALLDDTRLLTVSGPGGTGKTRFAIELASRQLEDFSNGVFWVPLAALRDPALVLEEAARVLGAKDGLPAHIAERKMLLLLDNFEQVVEAASGLSELLRACPNLRLLVTSRETLRVEGETEYGLPPLTEDEGVGLFSARARVEPTAAVSDLCRRLDGLPLAIELAAARAKVLAPEELMERLSERLDLLKGGRDAESRHATLRATIAWSHELLSPEDRQLFARMAVFAGGCTLEAAEEVCAADVDTLQSLLDKSLLRRTNGRYWMLETIREYAGERLIERADRQATEDRHTDYFLHLAEEAHRHVQGPDEREWFGRLDPEHDNIRAALAHAIAARDAAVELRIAVAVAPFRIRRGYLSEGRLSLEHALAFRGLPELRALALHHAGWIAALQGQNEEAERLLAEGLALARELEDHKLTARQLLTLAGIVSVRDEDEAQGLYDELLAFIAQHPEERFPNAFINLADFAVQRGDYERARDFSSQSIELYREEGDPWALALAIANHGLALLGLGQTEEALGHFREALRLHESIQDTIGVATMLSVIAAATAEHGETERAVRLLASAELMIEDTEAELTGFEATLHERTVALTRGECADFEAEWSRGRALTMEQAMAEALGDAAGGRTSPAGSTSSSRATG
jgi:predicted ATPase/class 3 adenylate cyclase